MRRLLPAVLAAASVVLCASACVPDPRPSPTPTPAVTVTVAPSSSAIAPTWTSQPSSAPEAGQTVTFTYDCYVEMPTENNPFGVTAPFDSWEAVWANADITSCKATRHGTVTTALQEHAIVTGLAAYRGDRDFALEGLHIQCAITDNGYLGINPLTGMQVDEVRGMLVLCPHRPGADDLREALPAS